MLLMVSLLRSSLKRASNRGRSSSASLQPAGVFRQRLGARVHLHGLGGIPCLVTLHLLDDALAQPSGGLVVGVDLRLHAAAHVLLLGFEQAQFQALVLEHLGLPLLEQGICRAPGVSVEGRLVRLRLLAA
jgi:hypothetical protein